MRGRSVGFVEFRDLQFKTRSRIIVTLMPPDNMTIISLDQNDPEVGGVLGAGDLEVGLDRANLKKLLSVVQKAISSSFTGKASWETIGKAEFSWSDHTKEETGDDSGAVIIESSDSDVRVVFRTKKSDWEPYVATFSPTVLNELSALLSRALTES